VDVVLLDLGLFCRHLGNFVVWADCDVGQYALLALAVFEKLGVESVVLL
jgi:hypothetical protein